jgi:hypothetical protein
MGANNDDFQGGIGRLYAGRKGLGRLIHIHTEPDPDSAYRTTGVKSLCGQPLDSDLTGYGRTPIVAILNDDKYPGSNDPIWETHNVDVATCGPCNKAAKKLRGAGANND